MIVQKLAQVLSDLKSGIRSVVPVILLVFYSIIGALIFVSIEGPNEEYELRQLKAQREKLLEVRKNTVLFQLSL